MRPLIWGALFVCFPAFSSSEVPVAYVLAANAHRVPAEVLYAVASTESIIDLDIQARPWPWTLNIAGEGMRFKDRASACDALTTALQTTQLVDVGITQLNVRWQPQLFGTQGRFSNPCDGLDPYANLDAAAALIRHHYDDTNDWLLAAGRYHRPAGGAPAIRYRSQVQQVLKQLSWTPDDSQKEATTHATSLSGALIWVVPKPYINQQAAIQWVEPNVALSEE